MNGLQQLESLLIGTEEDAAALEEKGRVVLLVVADTHGEYDVLEAIVRSFGPKSDALLFAGDGVWDAVACMSRAFRSDSLKKALPPVIAMAQGNGDAESYRICTDGTSAEETPVFERNGYPVFLRDRQLIKAGGRTVLLTHGHRLHVDIDLEPLISTALMMDCDMTFYGHTHRPFWEETEGILVLNPGSCARPRGGMPATFAVVEFPVPAQRYAVQFYKITQTRRGYRFSKFFF